AISLIERQADPCRGGSHMRRVHKDVRPEHAPDPYRVSGDETSCEDAGLQLSAASNGQVVIAVAPGEADIESLRTSKGGIVSILDSGDARPIARLPKFALKSAKAARVRVDPSGQVIVYLGVTGMVPNG